MIFPLNYLCNFTSDQQKTLENIRVINKEELKSWSLFTITLPITTFLFAVLVNALLGNNFQCEWSKFINNGSLPIISFGIVSSALSYLVDKLSGNNDTVFEIRKRITGVALLLLFVTSSLFILQSLSFITITPAKQLIILAISLAFTLYSIKLGRLMFLVQSSFADNYIISQQKSIELIDNGLKDEFGDII